MLADYRRYDVVVVVDDDDGDGDGGAGLGFLLLLFLIFLFFFFCLHLFCRARGCFVLWSCSCSFVRFCVRRTAAGVFKSDTGSKVPADALRDQRTADQYLPQLPWNR